MSFKSSVGNFFKNVWKAIVNIYNVLKDAYTANKSKIHDVLKWIWNNIMKYKAPVWAFLAFVITFKVLIAILSK